MLKHIANLLEDKSLYSAIILTFLIACLSLTSLQIKIPEVTFGYFDKVAHIIFYTLLSFHWLLALSLRKVYFLKTLLIITGILFYGIIIEVLQEIFTSSREADCYDVIANAIGVFLGFGMFEWWIHKRKLLK